MPTPETLKDAIRKGLCVPFVGAGVSMAVEARTTGKPLYPSWGELLLKCSERLQKENKPEEANLIRAAISVGAPDYYYAARKAKEYLGPIWFKVLREILDPPISSVNKRSLQLAEEIWKLGSKLIITTNFDRVLQWASTDSADLQLWEIESRAPMVNVFDSPRRPTIWHLHGHIQNPTDLILTPDGYELLYGSTTAESKYQASIHTLRHALVSRTVLFIGFSGDDAYIAAQIKRIANIFSGAAGPHYILTKKGSDDRTKGLNLPIERLQFDDYGAPLINLLKELQEVVQHENIESPSQPNPPTISIVSANEDTNSLFKSQPTFRAIDDLSQVTDFDVDLIKDYRHQLRLDVLDLYPSSLTNREFLEQLGYIRNDYLTIAGVLLFTKCPSGISSTELVSAVAQCVIYEGRTRASERNRIRFAGSLLTQIVDARDFIAKNIKRIELPVEHTMRSVIEYEYPMICVREIIANALCHRDYSDPKRMTHIRIFSDRIEISSPGTWFGARPIERGSHSIDKFAGQSVQRNMHLAHGVSMASIVEMEGSGIPTSIYNCEGKDAPLPTVSEVDGFVQVVIHPRRHWDKRIQLGRAHISALPDIELLQQMLNAAVAKKDKKIEAETLANLAHIYLGIRSYQEAHELSQRAVNLALEINNETILKQAKFSLIKSGIMIGKNIS